MGQKLDKKKKISRMMCIIYFSGWLDWGLFVNSTTAAFFTT